MNTANMRVRVVDFVTLDAGIDSTICLTDTFQLNPQTDGLKFEWTSDVPGYFDNPNVKQPKVRPASNTTYHVVAHIGKCFAEDELTHAHHPIPYSHGGRRYACLL